MRDIRDSILCMWEKSYRRPYSVVRGYTKKRVERWGRFQSWVSTISLPLMMVVAVRLRCSTSGTSYTTCLYPTVAYNGSISLASVQWQQ